MLRSGKRSGGRLPGLSMCTSRFVGKSEGQIFLSQEARRAIGMHLVWGAALLGQYA
jgi:hypothetical protein